MNVLTKLHAFVAVLRLARKRNRSRAHLWILTTRAGCLLLGLILCLTLAAIFEIGDDALRRNTLNLVASLAALAWFVAGAVLRIDMSAIFDFRQCLPLPVGFRTLFGFRVAAGLSGLWIPIFGPSLVYLLMYRAAGLPGVVVVLLATLALVVLLGRLVAVAMLKFDALATSWLVTAALLTAVIIALFALEPTIQNRLLEVSAESTPSGVAKQLSNSQLLAAMSYLPSGLLVGILDAPHELGANFTRLAGLWLATFACLTLEYRVLRRHLLHRMSPATSVSGVHVSLAPILRRLHRLSPETCLVLIEFETLMRMNWYRGMMLAMLFLMPVVQTGNILVLLWPVLMVLAAFLNVRSHSYGVAHRSIGERFAMPIRLIAPATAYAAAVSAGPALVFSATLFWTWHRVGWPGLGTWSLWLALPFCALVAGHGDGVYQSARSPSPFDFTPYAGKLPSSSPVWSSVAFRAAMIGLPLLLAFLAPRTTWGPAAAVCGAAILILGAAVFNARMLGLAERLVRSDPHRILRRLSASSGK